MRSIFALIYKELSNFFIGYLGYLFIAFFIFTCGIFTFYVGDFYERNTADLSSFFSTLPLVLIFFIPAITMRSFAEEKKAGTMELLLALPTGISKIIAGKYLAVLIFASIAITLTSIFVITVNYLGNPDNGIILASYIGAIFLSAAYIAISIAISASTGNQVIAFIISFMICAIFTLPGFSAFTSFLESFLPQNIIENILNISLINSYKDFTKGYIIFADIIYLIIFIIFWLLITYLILTARENKFKNILYLIILILLLAPLHYLSGKYITWSFDFTSNKIYTLSKNSENSLKNLDKNIKIKFFYSPDIIIKSPLLQNYTGKINGLLDKFNKLSDRKITVEHINPVSFSPQEDEAVSYGMQSVNISDYGKKLYFGIAIIGEDENEIIPFLNPEREQFLEYDLIKIIYRLSETEKPKIGIISQIDLSAERPLNASFSLNPGKWKFVELLNRYYDVKIIPTDAPHIDEDIETLIIIHPHSFNTELNYIIDQFILKGNNAVIFVDPFLEILNSRPNASDFNIFFDKWGIDFTKNVVLDPENSLRVSIAEQATNLENIEKLNWLRLTNPNFNKNNIITRNLEYLHFISAGGFFIKADITSPLEHTPLIITSILSGETDPKNLSDPKQLLTSFKPGNNIYMLATKINGKFNSIFDKSSNPAHIYKAEKESNIIIVGDVDMLRDQFWVSKQQSLGDNFDIKIADNAYFLLNSIDVLSDNLGLIDIRGKSIAHKSFQKVDKIRKDAEVRFLRKEQELKDELYILEEEIISSRNAVTLQEQALESEKQQEKMTQIRNRMLKIRKELRDVSYNLSKEVAALGTLLKIIHIILLPLLIIIFAPFIIYLIRR